MQYEDEVGLQCQCDEHQDAVLATAKSHQWKGEDVKRKWVHSVSLQCRESSVGVRQAESVHSGLRYTSPGRADGRQGSQKQTEISVPCGFAL